MLWKVSPDGLRIKDVPSCAARYRLITVWRGKQKAKDDKFSRLGGVDFDSVA